MSALCHSSQAAGAALRAALDTAISRFVPGAVAREEFARALNAVAGNSILVPPVRALFPMQSGVTVVASGPTATRARNPRHVVMPGCEVKGVSTTPGELIAENDDFSVFAVRANGVLRVRADPHRTAR